MVKRLFNIKKDLLYFSDFLRCKCLSLDSDKCKLIIAETSYEHDSVTVLNVQIPKGTTGKDWAGDFCRKSFKEKVSFV